MGKKRVVIIQDYNTPYRNDLFNAISSFEDIDLHLVYVGARSADRKWTDPLRPAFSEHPIPVRTIPLSYSENVHIVDFKAMRIEISRISPEVIITQPGKLATFIFLVRLLQFKPIKFIFWNESTILTTKGKPLNWKYRFFRRIFSAFLSVGKLSDEYLKSVGFRVNEKNLFRAMNSVDSTFNITEGELSRKVQNIRPLKILFVGNFIKRKGFDILQNVIVKLNRHFGKSEFEFHLAGAGDLAPVSAGNVFDHGFLSKTEAIPLYKQCHALVLPSLWDCNPLVATEAARCGNILLLSDGAGNYPELLKNNGILFERNNEQALFDALSRLRGETETSLLSMMIESTRLASDISHYNTASAFREAIKFVTKT